ncbi:MAG: alpha/beta fold hydrolase [Rhodocyclaceae bacterium]|nr:alpha/beta fold hydrolase [Rhodocyclaceae bacterium]MDZ4216226.1 alpha/beta fold hydrolase [Rhodocyclaceae bacterium]
MKIEANGINIHYEISGSGPVVMFAHSLGSDHSIWAAQKSALAGRHTVLAYDLRGHGKTTASPGAYTFDLLAADAIALLDALQIEKASFVGISLGGMIGQAVALAAPQRIDKLVLADTTCAYPPEAQAAWPERIRQIAASGLEPLVLPTLERWFTAPYRAAHPEVIERIGALIRATPVAGYLGCCHAIAQLDFSARLKTLPMPALVVVGDSDPGIPLPLAQALAVAISGAQLAVIPGAAHLANIEQADAFNQLLLNFL